MTFRLGLAQIGHPQDGDVLSKVRKYARLASEYDVDMLIFPESLMTRFEEDQQKFLDDAEPVHGPFARAMDAIASEFGLWLVYTMNELNDAGGLPRNTAVIVDATGSKRGVYRKVHLFDSQTVQESSRMSAGNSIFNPIDTPYGKVGLGVCYDLRFPELARKQALEGCELLIYPAAWVEGPNKAMQWRALLQARAIENELFVVGVCRTDDGYVGRSYVFGPDGCELAGAADSQEQLLVAEIDTTNIETVRKSIPSLAHRREDLY